MIYNDKTSKLKILVARITLFGIPSSTGGKKDRKRLHWNLAKKGRSMHTVIKK